MRFLRGSILLAVGVLATLPSVETLPAQETKPRPSGLQPGDKMRSFYVEDVTGIRKGKSLCYACAFGKHAVVNIQAREMTSALIDLIRKLDTVVDSPASIKGDSKHAFVVYITDDPEAAAQELSAIAKKHKIENVPLTIFSELTGPRGYKLAPDAEVTVMMWKDTIVSVNHTAASDAVTPAFAERVWSDARKHVAKR